MECNRWSWITFSPPSFLTVCITPGQSRFPTGLHPGRRHQQAEAHGPPHCSFPPDLTCFSPQFKCCPRTCVLLSVSKKMTSLLCCSSAALMAWAVVVTPDPWSKCSNAVAALVGLPSCLPCIICIYNFAGGVFNFYICFCYVALLIGQKTSQHTHTHTKKRYFKWEMVHLNNPILTYRYCLVLSVWLCVFVKYFYNAAVVSYKTKWWFLNMCVLFSRFMAVGTVFINRKFFFQSKYLPQEIYWLRTFCNIVTVQTC